MTEAKPMPNPRKIHSSHRAWPQPAYPLQQAARAGSFGVCLPQAGFCSGERRKKDLSGCRAPHEAKGDWCFSEFWFGLVFPANSGIHYAFSLFSGLPLAMSSSSSWSSSLRNLQNFIHVKYQDKPEKHCL